MKETTVKGALIATTLVVVAKTTGAAMYFVLGAVYLLLRDVVNGQSIGKLMFGLAVVDLETGQRTSWRGAIRRNLVLLLPGANLAAVFLEARTILTDAQGQRLGDRIAQTQVVEGFGVRDVATSLQKWLRHLADIPGESRPRRGESGDVGRAA